MGLKMKIDKRQNVITLYKLNRDMTYKFSKKLYINKYDKWICKASDGFTLVNAHEYINIHTEEILYLYPIDKKDKSLMAGLMMKVYVGMEDFHKVDKYFTKQRNKAEIDLYLKYNRKKYYA